MVSLARESHPDELPSGEPLTTAKDATNSATIIAQTLLWTASLRGADTLKRLLVVEPRTRNISVALRAEGFNGETTALMHMPSPRGFGIVEGFDRVLTDDWLPPVNGEMAQAEDATITEAKVRARLGVYDALIVSDLTRTLSPGQLSGTLAWLSNCLDTHGLLALAEPAHTVNVIQLTRELIQHGLELVADPEYVAEDWPRALMIWRRRTPSEAVRSGVAQRISWAQLAQDRPLQRQLISSYQKVFGGEEWSEWVKCVRPGCGRHYSYSEALTLEPQGYCSCGWHEPLALFHPAEDILARLYRDLTPPEASCAYFRFGDVDADSAERRIDGFAWGYLTDPYRLARALFPVQPDDRDAEARNDLLLRLTSLLHRAHIRDNPAVIYYHADSGVVENTRSLSLTRYLFERSLRFALEQGARTVILRTSLRSPAFRLLVGLGMRPLFWYGGDEQAEWWRAGRSNAGASKPESGVAQTEPEVDERVVLWGEASALLGIFSTHSDFRLAGRIARGLRAARDEGEHV